MEMGTTATNSDRWTTIIADYVALVDQKTELEDRVREVKERIADLAMLLIDHMHEDGVSGLRWNGRTIYIHRALWSSIIDRSALSDIRDLGFGDLIQENVNAQALSAWVREFPAGDDGLPVLPESLKTKIKVSETFTLRVRKGE